MCPRYIDRVVSLNEGHQGLARAGLAWLTSQAQRRFSREYAALDDSQHVALLQPLSEAVDREVQEQQQARYRGLPGGRIYYFAVTDAAQPARPALAIGNDPTDARMPIRFFRLIKNLTADGYYTSRVGLLEELGYLGNTFRRAFRPVRCRSIEAWSNTHFDRPQSFQHMISYKHAKAGIRHIEDR